MGSQCECALERNSSYKVVNRKGLIEKRAVMHSDGTRGMDEEEKINKSEREKSSHIHTDCTIDPKSPFILVFL